MAQAEKKTSVAIIGSGMGGLCMAIKLLEAGYKNIVIYEKASSLGGTWRDNTYPGSGCDVPSHLYSFSFEPNANWSRKFAKQEEILHYMQHCAEKYQITRLIQFNTEIVSANFDEESGTWQLHDKNKQYEAQILVCACGQLNRPALPNLPGIQSFSGKAFHSANWQHDYELTDKKIAVIGTGASAIQFIPQIAKKAGKLHIFQRSPNWMIPKPDRKYFSFEHKLLNLFPILTRFYRYSIYCSLEVRFSAFFKGSIVARLFEKWAAYNMRKQLKTEELQQAMLPDYPIGCKRILISNDYYPALNQDNVVLHRNAVTAIHAEGVTIKEDDSDKNIKVDTIIFGTGFESTSFLAPMQVTGLNDTKLNNAWNDGAEAYYGMTVAGFPNFFMLYGPNTNLGHNSIIFMIESQVRYIIQCLAQLEKQQADYLHVDDKKMSTFNNKIQQAIRNSVWDSGCSSWYKTASGKITNNWPHFTLQYWWQTRKPDFSFYHFQKVEKSTTD